MDTREINPFGDEPLPPHTPPTPEEEAAQEAVYWMLESEVCGLCQDPSPGDLPHPHQPPLPDHCPTAPTDYHADYPCECGGPASYATGYCRPCEEQRGIPPALHLSPAARQAVRLAALRSLGVSPDALPPIAGGSGDLDDAIFRAERYGESTAMPTAPAPETVSQRVDRELAEDAVRAAAAFAAGRCWVCDRPLADYPSLESQRECYFCAEELRCQIAELREED
jgi:hypothetical protein